MATKQSHKLRQDSLTLTLLCSSCSLRIKSSSPRKLLGSGNYRLMDLSFQSTKLISTRMITLDSELSRKLARSSMLLSKETTFSSLRIKSRMLLFPSSSSDSSIDYFDYDMIIFD